MVPGLAVTLPVEETPYHQFWRSPGNAVWRPIVTMLSVGAGFVFVSLVFGLLALIIDPPKTLDPRGIVVTPVLFLANNLSLAAVIPLSIGLAVLFLRQPAGYLASVAGRIRWRWMFKVAALLAPIWAIEQAFMNWLLWDQMELAFRPHTIPMIAIILTTQVFQCAGEEYGFRGIINRGIGGLIGHETVSFLVSAVFSSLLFMVIHNAQDVWLNLFYFVFGMLASYVTWRTGGLEAAIAIHSVNNLSAMVFVPFSDISKIFDRSTGTGSVLILVNLAFLLVGVWVVLRFAKEDALVQRAAPGRELLARQPQAWPYPPLGQWGFPPNQPMPGASQPVPHPGQDFPQWAPTGPPHPGYPLAPPQTWSVQAVPTPPGQETVFPAPHGLTGAPPQAGAPESSQQPSGGRDRSSR